MSHAADEGGSGAASRTEPTPDAPRVDCPRCGVSKPAGGRFCSECGSPLRSATAPRPPLFADGERKQVTVLFSDLCGFTALSERIDPEELREIVSGVFTRATRIVAFYGGYVDKLMGDGLMALFGYPQLHEDDAVRAIKSAREIHAAVEEEGERFRNRTGEPLRMHSGISTGQVVTGELDHLEGRERVLGDTVNVASRLTDHATAGEILVADGTKQLAERFFSFEPLGPTPVKGKQEHLAVWRVLAEREMTAAVHRISGRRARLVGRQGELTRLRRTVERLRTGAGSVVTLLGEAGAGKSRLAAEFRTSLGGGVRWLEGRSYSFSQNMPYFLLANLLGRAWGIERDDPRELVREKVERNVAELLGPSSGVAPYVGRIFGLKYPELETVDGEFWKRRLFEGTRRIISTLSARGPTVWCLEDLHWTDPSSLELFQAMISGADQPAVYLCVHRPGLSLFPGELPGAMAFDHQEIRLGDLSADEAGEMLGSLLGTERLPAELAEFIRDKGEGNPFYLEEVVNALIESGVLVRDEGSWKLERPLSEAGVPLTISGVIASRLDRLEVETKRILQEAAVIGRAFQFDVLQRVTELRERLTGSLDRLETADLVRKRTLDPVLEYIFKHALTQDVAYNSLLKKERETIHERIGEVIEGLFGERLPEFYETLAFHFSRGRSVRKAVEYLVKAGEKSQRHFAVEEAHGYYQQALELLREKAGNAVEDGALLVDLLCEWALVFYYRGDYAGMGRLLTPYRELAESLPDRSKLGLYYAWLGEVARGQERYEPAYDLLRRAVRLGEETGNPEAVAYACQSLGWLCPEMGLFEEGRAAAERVLEIAREQHLDPFLQVKALGALGLAHYLAGEAKKAYEKGREILEYGERNSNVRGMVMGYWIMSFGRFADGDIPDAVRLCETAVGMSVDPHYAQFPKSSLGAIYLANRQFREADTTAAELLAFQETHGSANLGSPAQAISSILKVVKGDISRGMKEYEALARCWLENRRICVYALSQNIIGSVFLNMVLKSAPISLATIVRNLGFLMRNVPVAQRKAESYFARAIEVGGEFGLKGTVAQGYLNLGLLHRAKGRKEQARECLLRAAEVFEQCEALTFLHQAREALRSLE